MKKIRTTLYLLLIIISGISCNDILEEDISEERVDLLAPADNLVSATSTHSFWWSAVQGADAYHLQIVSPGFDSTVSLIADEIIEGDVSFEISLPEGKYQWRVSAFNSAYQSLDTIFNLIINSDGSGGGLANEKVIITAPDNQAVINQADVLFSWQPLSAAKSYRLQLAQPDFSSASNIIETKEVAGSSTSLTLQEGTYQWRVRAENEFENSSYSDRAFRLDFTAPAAPELESPLNNAIINLPVELSWTTTDNDIVLDSVYVYSDSLQSAPILRQAVAMTKYSFDNSDYPTYFWRVRSVDAAGNVSGYSALRKFVVQ